jgi:hypothetical protein
VNEPIVEGLPPWETLDQDTASLVPYARQLRDLVYRRLYPDGSTDLGAVSADAMFDEALRTVLERMISDRLAALTPAEFAAAYRAVCGDAALADALDGLAALHEQDLARETRLLRMRREALVSGRLILAELSTGEVLTIGLFDPDRPRLAAKRFSENQEIRPLHRVLRVRLTEPAVGRCEVVNDTWTGALWSRHLQTPLVAPLTPGVVGTQTPDAPIRPELTLHAPLVFAPDSGEVVRPPQLVGYVETLDGQVVLDAP